MSEILRPTTQAVWRAETYHLGEIEEAIQELQQTGKPVTLWWDKHRSDRTSRNIELSDEERDEVIVQVFMACGVGRDFHDQIRILRNDSFTGDHNIVPTKETFGDEKPLPKAIFQWLGDVGRGWADDPNDFTVGFAVESPVGIIATIYRSEEPFVDDDTLESEYQIVLYPKDHAEEINWFIWHG